MCSQALAFCKSDCSTPPSTAAGTCTGSNKNKSLILQNLEQIRNGRTIHVNFNREIRFPIQWWKEPQGPMARLGRSNGSGGPSMLSTSPFLPAADGVPISKDFGRPLTEVAPRLHPDLVMRWSRHRLRLATPTGYGTKEALMIYDAHGSTSCNLLEGLSAKLWLLACFLLRTDLGIGYGRGMASRRSARDGNVAERSRAEWVRCAGFLGPRALLSSAPPPLNGCFVIRSAGVAC